MTTLHDIARRMNVSYMTVARVLSGQNKENRPGSIARAQKIRRIAREMGYRPNAAARAVTQGRFNNVVLVLSQNEETSYLPAPLCCGIEAALASRQCRLSLSHIPDGVLTDDDRLSCLLGEAFADGMLVDYTHRIPAVFGQLVSKYRIPAIWLNTLRPDDAVRPDDFQGGMLATEYLLSQGHRRVAYLDVLNSTSAMAAGAAHYSVTDRHAGYLAAMQKAGLQPESFFPKTADGSLRPGDLPVEQILRPDGPTALISYGHEYLIRLHTLAELRDRPVQLVTFGESPSTFSGQIPIQTVIIPATEVGQAAVEMLFQKITTQESLPSRVIPYQTIASFSDNDAGAIIIPLQSQCGTEQTASDDVITSDDSSGHGGSATTGNGGRHDAQSN